MQLEIVNALPRSREENRFSQDRRRLHAPFEQREVTNPHAEFVFATFHPSALLRLRDAAEREAAFRELVEDLSLIRKALEKHPA